jgi:hypothetical protein
MEIETASPLFPCLPVHRLPVRRLGAVSERRSNLTNTPAGKFIDGYSHGAPAFIFLVPHLGSLAGLPDSFRTGDNTPNHYLNCMVLEEVYMNRFSKKEPLPNWERTVEPA